MLRLDQTGDLHGIELVQFSKLYEFPEFVKSASTRTLRPEGIPASSYADPSNKQFPCHTKAACWLSALYFTEKRAELHPKTQGWIAERLAGYVRYWGIKEAVDKIEARHKELNKDATDQLPDSAFAWVWINDDKSAKERHLPLRNAMEVKTAAEWLEHYRDRIPFADRNVIANKIIVKANQYGAATKNSEFLEKTAGRGVCDPKKVVAMIEGRAMLASGDQRAAITKLAHCVKTSARAALQPDMLIKLAVAVDTVDRQLGIAGKYTDRLPRPEDIIFEATFNKVANDLVQHTATTSGKVYHTPDFKKVALADLRGLFGDEFADRVKTAFGEVDAEKLAEEAATLPRPDAEALDSLLADSSVRPVMAKAASQRVGFDPGQWGEIANSYLPAMK